MRVVTLGPGRLRNSRLSRWSRGRSGGSRCFGSRSSRGQLREVRDNLINRLLVEVELDTYCVGNQLFGFIIGLRCRASENGALAFMQDLQLWENFRHGGAVIDCWVYIIIWCYPGNLGAGSTGETPGTLRLLYGLLKHFDLL